MNHVKVLTHNSAESVLSTLQFSSPILHAILVSILISVLSHQAAAVVFDIALGFKRAGQAKASDLFIAHLPSQASIPALLTAIFDTQKFPWGRSESHKSFSGTTDISSNSDDGHLQARLKRPSIARFPLFKLVLLIILVPVINLFTLLLSLETDNSLTFGDARFGGLALGITNANQTIANYQTSVTCQRYNTSFGYGVSESADFTVCAQYFLLAEDIRRSNVTVRGVWDSGTFNGEVTADTTMFSIAIVGNVRVGKKLFRLRQKMWPEEFFELMRNQHGAIMQKCDSGLDSRMQSSNGGSEILFTTYCSFLISEDIILFLRGFQRAIGLVEDDELYVADASEGKMAAIVEFVSRDDLLLLKRRRPYFSLAAVMIMTGIVVIVGAIVSCLTRNDTYLGIEIIVKKVLKLNKFDSLLGNKEVIRYVDEGVDDESGMKMTSIEQDYCN